MLPETLLNPTSNPKPNPNVSSKPTSKPVPVRLDRVDALLEADLDELEEKSKLSTAPSAIDSQLQKVDDRILAALNSDLGVRLVDLQATLRVRRDDLVKDLQQLVTARQVVARDRTYFRKTTLALHLADLHQHPMMLMFGDDEAKTSDLIGKQSGYTRKKIVDNYIHSVVKVEDHMRQTWVDSRLTLACREEYTLIYDEFSRSRPEVNNVLLSVLEEKILVLPPESNRVEYLKDSPQFRAIFTSNPEEYCGVHAT